MSTYSFLMLSTIPIWVVLYLVKQWDWDMIKKLYYIWLNGDDK
jgi:hypothetical protein